MTRYPIRKWNQLAGVKHLAKKWFCALSNHTPTHAHMTFSFNAGANNNSKSSKLQQTIDTSVSLAEDSWIKRKAHEQHVRKRFEKVMWNLTNPESWSQQWNVASDRIGTGGRVKEKPFFNFQSQMSNHVFSAYNQYVCKVVVFVSVLRSSIFCLSMPENDLKSCCHIRTQSCDRLTVAQSATWRQMGAINSRPVNECALSVSWRVNGIQGNSTNGEVGLGGGECGRAWPASWSRTKTGQESHVKNAHITYQDTKKSRSLHTPRRKKFVHL